MINLDVNDGGIRGWWWGINSDKHFVKLQVEWLLAFPLHYALK